MNLITAGSNSDADALRYAYQNWSRRIHMALSYAKDVGYIKSNLEPIMKDISTDMFEWFTGWMLSLENHAKLKRVRDELHFPITCGAVRQPIWNVITSNAYLTRNDQIPLYILCKYLRKQASAAVDVIVVAIMQ
jgi:hypothetical protein